MHFRRAGVKHVEDDRSRLAAGRRAGAHRSHRGREHAEQQDRRDGGAHPRHARPGAADGRERTRSRSRAYVALGDSMSIDLYPALDAGEIDVAVALERVRTAGAVAPLGAASLLYRNDDARWPEEQGADLVSCYPGHRAAEPRRRRRDDRRRVRRAAAAARGERRAHARSRSRVGGNDLLSAFANRPRASLLERDRARRRRGVRVPARRSSPRAAERADPADDDLRSVRPASGAFPGVLEDAGTLPLSVLDGMNAHIRTLARGTPGVALARRVRALPRTWRERARGGSLVLAPLARRAERAGRARDPPRLARRARRRLSA